MATDIGSQIVSSGAGVVQMFQKRLDHVNVNTGPDFCMSPGRSAHSILFCVCQGLDWMLITSGYFTEMPKKGA